MTTEYKQLLQKTLEQGTQRQGEKPETTLSIFGEQLRFDYRDGFPLITLRDLSASWDKIITKEVCWIVSGSTSAKEAEERFGLTLWNRWAEDSEKKLGTPPGELGPIYGHQLRSFNGRTDQLRQVLEMLKRAPESRRGVISMWNLEDVEIDGVKKVNVANCVDRLHLSRSYYRTETGAVEPRLDMSIVHRSVDLPAGGPFDWALWGCFQLLAANEIGIEPGTLVGHIDDGQIYDLQIPKVQELITREPLPLPTVTLREGASIYNPDPRDFKLENYQAHPKLFMPTAT